MINAIVQQMILAAFTIWPSPKAEQFQKHMEPILMHHTLNVEQVNAYANTFTYLPPNNLIKCENSKQELPAYYKHPTYHQ